MNLHIRKMDINDLDDLYILLSDEEVMRYIEPPFSKEEVVDFIKRYGDIPNPRVFSVLDGQNFLGYVIFHDYDETSIEIGWMLKKEYWNKGIASRLTKILINRVRKANKDAIIECDTQQEVSKHIALKCGFKYFGTIDGLDVYKKELRG